VIDAAFPIDAASARIATHKLSVVGQTSLSAASKRTIK